MNIISVKVLSRLLFTICMVFTSNSLLANAKVPYEITPEQQLIHLNNSTVAELVTLKGIGESKAQAIVSYRKQVGSFKSINELMNVKGIGEKIILDNKSRLII